MSVFYNEVRVHLLISVEKWHKESRCLGARLKWEPGYRWVLRWLDAEAGALMELLSCLSLTQNFSLMCCICCPFCELRVLPLKFHTLSLLVRCYPDSCDYEIPHRNCGSESSYWRRRLATMNMKWGGGGRGSKQHWPVVSLRLWGQSAGLCQARKEQSWSARGSSGQR